MVNGKAGDETNNYSSTSTRIDNRSLVKHIEDEYSVYNHERRSSLPWWSTFLETLGSGSCGGRSG